MSRPNATMRPEVGFTNPVSMWKSVVFPAPFGPTRA